MLQEREILIDFVTGQEEAQAPKSLPSQILGEYEQMAHSHKYSYVQGENTVLHQVDKGNQEMIGLITPNLGRELFKLVEFFDSMGMNVNDVMQVVEADDARRAERHESTR